MTAADTRRAKWRPTALGKTLFGKISLVFCVMLLLLAGLQVLFTFHSWRRSLERAEQIIQWDTAAYLAGRIERLAADSIDIGKIDEEAFAIFRANGKIGIYLLDESGSVVHSLVTDNSWIRPTVRFAPIRAFLAPGASSAAPILGDDPTTSNDEAIFSVAPLRFRGRPMYLYIVFSNRRWRNVSVIDYENAIFATVGAWSILSIAAISLGALFLFRLLTRRFSKITETVRHYHDGDFTRRIGFTGDDELGVLGANIDAMADQIEESLGALQERDALRRDLIANVSHDLRGPLTNIRGNFELLEQTVDRSRAGEELEGFRDTMRRNLEYLSELLAQLFELAKLEAQELQPQFEIFPIDELAGDLAASYRSRAESKQLTLEVRTDVRPAFIRGDIRILDRVLMNLIENAMKFTPAGGAIIIDIGLHGERRRVSVSDTGAGIAADELPGIFKSYTQGRNAPKTGGSTGLGLAIVDRLLRIHGSRISVESEVGKGTKFFFDLERA